MEEQQDLVEQLQYLNETKGLIKQAIINKGQSISADDTFRSYVDKINNITTSEDLETELSAQEQLIQQMKIALASKTAGSGVKIFDTVEHMQEDTSAKDGDLALVYREEIQPIQEDSEFDNCIFPNTVVLDEAFSGEIYGSFRSIDGGWFDGNVDMSSSSFRFDGYGDSSEIRVEYESQDGITYTRTDGGDELQEFGTTIKWESWGDAWNSVIGNFMKMGGNYFDGVFNYKTHQSKDIANIVTQLSLVNDIPTLVQEFTNISSLNQALTLIDNSPNYSLFPNGTAIFISPNIVKIYDATGISSLSGINNDKFIFSVYAFGSNPDYTADPIKCYTVDLQQQSITFESINWKGRYVRQDGINYHIYIYSDIEVNGSFIRLENYTSIQTSSGYGIYRYYIDGSSSSIYRPLQFAYGSVTDYTPIKSQLDASTEYVFKKTFYGNDGVKTGMLGVNLARELNDIDNEVFGTLYEKYQEITPIQSGTINKDTKIIPSKYDGTLLLDTSTATTISCMNGKLIYLPHLDTTACTGISITGCTDLKEVSLLDTSNCTYLKFTRLFVIGINTSI